MTKKALAILLSIATAIALFGGCKREAPPEHQLVVQTTAQVTEDTEGFKISYSQSDSLNPFESDTLNNQTAQDLVFEPLFRIDESFEAVPEIASSYTYEDADTLTVTIVSGLTFSDGSPLTAKNVVSSFNEAKQSPRWKNSLAPIYSASTVSDTVIKFKMSYANPYAHQLLTFYIAKVTGNSKFPIGSGRYKFTESEGKLFAEKNELYKEEFNPRFTKIQLVNVPSAESINNAINIGNISYAYRDNPNDSITRLKCGKKQVALNNMVYLGLHTSMGATSKQEVRRAISLAVDRTTLAKSAYQGYARPSTSLFNPVSRIGRETQIFANSADIAAAKQALASAGYSDGDVKLKIVVNQNEQRVAVAKLVERQLESAGFDVTVKSYNQKVFNDALKYGTYDIYIGETKIPNDMRLSSFFDKKGKTAFGINTDSQTASLYRDYLNGKAELGKFILSFSEDMPFIPVVYRNGVICYSKAMHGDMQGSYGNFFSNIEDWYYN